MSYTLFISDLHLAPDTPAVTHAFKALLSGPAQKADALYILGDFFETWIGDDDQSSFNLDVIKSLHHFTQTSKIPTYFMHGNRDFLIGERFAQQAGITLIPDPTLITLYSKRILLLHGDLLCTLDTEYQAFRKKRSHPLFKIITYITPLCIRRNIANKLRQKSKQHQKTVDSSITDVCPQEVEKFFKQYQVDMMIHGHTHRPAIHPNNRIVLGAWHNKASMLFVYKDQPPRLES